MRNVKQLPAIFQEVLSEFKFRSSAFNAMGITDLDEKQKRALYYICLEKLIINLSDDLHKIGDGILSESGSNDPLVILLPPYGLKLKFDEEACWFVTEVMTDKDWQEYDRKCNEIFLTKK